MIVVADTSPLNYLLLIGCVDVLPQLYGRVMIPPAVHDELRNTNAPDAVSAWAQDLPEWIEVKTSALITLNVELDAGEHAAISLAAAMKADLVLLDERAGRRAAQDVGLSVTGTLGIVEAAARREHIDLAEVMTRLRRTNFRLAPTLWSRFSRQSGNE